MKRDFSSIVIFGVIAAAILIAFFASSPSSNVGFVARGNISGPAAFTEEEEDEYVDCAEIFGPACGGYCAVVVSTPSGGLAIRKGVCTHLTTGGCGCQTLVPQPPVPLKCICDQPNCASEGSTSGGITVTYKGESCSPAGSYCTCPGTSTSGNDFGQCPTAVGGTCG